MNNNYYTFEFMSKRVHPFRKKCPEALIPIIEQSLELKLYLVNEFGIFFKIGPTNFEFKHEDGRKLKVSIGSTI